MTIDKLVKLHVNELLKKYNGLFHSERTRKLIYEPIIQLRTSTNPYEIRKKANDALMKLLHTNHLKNPLEIESLRAYDKREVKVQGDLTRRSADDRPEAVHSVSTLWLLSQYRSCFSVLIAGTGHDDPEGVKDIEKQKLKNPTIERLDDITNKAIRDQYRTIKASIEEAEGKLKARKEHYTPINPREILYACIMIQKLTRYESDNYPTSIFKILDEEIDYTKPQFRMIFLEYLRHIKNNKKLSRKDLKRFDKELTLFPEEKHEIIQGALLIKNGADRPSNTLESYERPPHKRLKEVVKNAWVAEAVTYYMSNKSKPKKTVSSQEYAGLNFSMKLSTHINKDRSLSEAISLIHEHRCDKKFITFVQECDMQRDEYRKIGGFDRADFRRSRENPYSGQFRYIWNPILNNETEIETKFDNNVRMQYRSWTGLFEVFTRYEKCKPLEGLEKVKELDFGKR